MSQRISEASLGPPVVAYLTDLRWEVYQEVTGPGGSVADIVCTQDRFVGVVEMKTGLGFDVFGQALHWKRWSHWTWVAVPAERVGSVARQTAIMVCKDHGIGVLEVRDDRVFVKAAPALQRTAHVDTLRSKLMPEQKTFALAGNAHSKRWTPFQATCKAVRDILEALGGSAEVGDVIRRIKHHYSADSAARASLVKWAEARKIPGVAVDRTGRRLRFRLEDEKK